MYKHVAVLEMRLEIDYEFSSDYGNITTQVIKESSILQSNRLVK